MIAQDSAAASRLAPVNPPRSDAAGDKEPPSGQGQRTGDDFGAVVADTPRRPSGTGGRTGAPQAAEADARSAAADPAAALVTVPAVDTPPLAASAAPAEPTEPIVAPEAARAKGAPVQGEAMVLPAPAADLLAGSDAARGEPVPPAEPQPAAASDVPSAPGPARPPAPQSRTTVAAPPPAGTERPGAPTDAAGDGAASDAAPRAAGSRTELPASPVRRDPTARSDSANTSAPALSLAPAGKTPDGALALQNALPATWHLASEPGRAPSEAPAPAPASVTVSPHAVLGQVVVAVARSSDRRLEIRLDPPELGRVQIHLTPLDGHVQAVVLADRPETQDLLRRHAGALARELGEAGYGSVSLDFGAGHQAPPERRNDGAPAFQAVAPATRDIPGAALPPAPRLDETSGALDVRL